jgi:hypothetical protein
MDVIRVYSSEPHRQEAVERLAHHFLCGIPEDSFCGRIKKNNPLLLIERNDAIRRGIYDTGQPHLAFNEQMLYRFQGWFVIHCCSPTGIWKEY